MKYWLVAAAAILVTVYVAECNALADRKGEMTMIEQQVMDIMKKLDTLDERSRMKLLSQVDTQRNELLGILLKHLGTSSSKNVQAAAIYLIGRHRLSDGVGELILRIDFAARSERRIPEPEPLWEEYPALEALITIGRPSISVAINLLATDPNDLRRTLAVKVIRYVEGPEVAEFILQRAEATESDVNRKAMLNDALLRLRKLIQQTR